MGDSQKMTTAEAAEYMGLSISTLNRARSKGEGPTYYKLMGSIFYKRTDLESYMEAGRTEPDNE